MRPSCTAILVLFSILAPLKGQGYETKFKTIRFQPGDVYHSDEGVNVSLNGGGLEVSIPLGPPMPGPIPIRPMAHYHGKYCQSLNTSNRPVGAELDNWVSCIENGDTLNFRRYSPPTFGFGEIHPGYLIFKIGNRRLRSGESSLTVTSHSGKSLSYFHGMSGTRTYLSSSSADVAELSSLVSTVAPEWAPLPALASNCSSAIIPSQINPNPTTVLGTSIGLRSNGGGILIWGPSTAKVWESLPQSWNVPPDTVLPVSTLLIPNEVLQIEEDLITLWRRSRDVYQVPQAPSPVLWDGSVFHPVWIKTRSGFKVTVDIYRAAPTNGVYSCLNVGGPLTGFRVSSNNGSTWFQVGGPAGSAPAFPVTFGGMGGIPGTTIDNSPGGIVSSDDGQYEGSPDASWQPGTANGYTYCPPQSAGDEGKNFASIGLSAKSISYGSLTTTMEGSGPYGLLSKLTTPNGKTYSFTYGLFTGLGPHADDALSSVRAWDFEGDAPNARDYWTSVVQMDVGDGAQTRSTSYHWKVPQVVPGGSNDVSWSSPAQGVAQTLPDGQTILHIFTPAVDLPFSSVLAQYTLPMNQSLLDVVARTFMAQRQVPIARYYFAQGETGWQAFISNGADPSTTNWYKRELMEGFDLRGWEASLTQTTSNTEPRPTRIIKEEKGGPVQVQELEGWDANRNQYAISRIYHLPPGTSTSGQFWAPGLFGGTSAYPAAVGTVDLATSTTTFAPIEAGLFNRPQRKVTQQVSAPASGTAGIVSDTSSTYNPGSQAHLIHDSDQNSIDGSALKLTTTFSYGPWNGITQVSGVSLSANGILGTTGFTYDYDGSGRWLTSIQAQGVVYRDQEPTHDWEGFPLSQIDVNGFETGFTRDDLGRLTGILPPFPELPTTVAYDIDFRGAVVTRGVASTHYRYTGFGELASVEKPTGEVKTFNYDLGGRKTFESGWSVLTGTNSYFDPQGRPNRTVDPNGVTTNYSYPTPLIKQVTRYPFVYGSQSITTTVFEQDSLGRLAKVTNGKGEVTQYTYDPTGKLSKVLQGIQSRIWSFNGLGWLTGLIQPESGTTTYSDFNVFGKPTTTNYAGRVVNTSYDVLGRVMDLSAVDGSLNQHFEYDGGIPFNGKLRYSTDRSSFDQGVLRMDYGYGGLNGRLDSRQTTVGPVVGAVVPAFQQTFSYDNYGNTYTTTLPSGRTITFTQDLSRSVVKSVSAYPGVPGGFGTLPVDMATIQTFDQNYNPIEMVFGNGAATTFGYSADQIRLDSMEQKKSGTILRKWTYAWDPSAQLTGDGDDTYQYDELGRLVLANFKPISAGPTISQAFTYDPYGNIVSSVANNLPIGVDRNFSNFTFNPPDLAPSNRLPSFTSQGAATGTLYDSQGNLTQLFKTVGDANKSINLTYDALGRVVQMTDAERGVTEKYFYTAEGLRTRIETYLSGILQKVQIKLYNDQRQLVSEYETAPPSPGVAARARTSAKAGK